VASFSGAGVGVDSGASSLVIGGQIEWIVDIGDDIGVVGVHITWGGSIGVEINVQAIVVLVPGFASGIDDVLGWSFVWSVLTESAPASVVGHG